MRTTLTLDPENLGSKPFCVEPHDFGFKAGIDLDKMNKLVDELEAFEDFPRNVRAIHPASRE